jgi:hypothetical protein
MFNRRLSKRFSKRLDKRLIGSGGLASLHESRRSKAAAQKPPLKSRRSKAAMS